MIHISGGVWRGRRLAVPNEPWIRPTMGKIRLALFTLLQPYLAESRVLDLFSGCGLLGLEALSRGAREVFFVDQQQKAVQSIAKNVTLCGVRQQCTLIQGDLLQERTWNRIALEESPASLCPPLHQKRFDLVLMDPPYRQGWIPLMVQRLRQSDLLAPGAIVAAEQEALAEAVAVEEWLLLQNRRYGDTRITVWQHTAVAKQSDKGVAC
ncbi:16S rRNA (guanine(966)-N(2))-methyltransferase RsmD [Candidatus Magnetaquicoccus inordinatus]|uniref:16S rRNA (guanine(966)-N(2))-methyltransferase RsmD n=1 Tax=Candidatus Magnetaquicoccus inordinatus TaxID=2496818 RepID=UPI00102C682F|nr:16S rRNA (guanine(966)-N(2))-methyltransferase RsmD [Candidatus Magnetaquicoccus inordinatus]